MPWQKQYEGTPFEHTYSGTSVPSGTTSGIVAVDLFRLPQMTIWNTYWFSDVRVEDVSGTDRYIVEGYLYPNITFNFPNVYRLYTPTQENETKGSVAVSQFIIPHQETKFDPSTGSVSVGSSAATSDLRKILGIQQPS